MAKGEKLSARRSFLQTAARTLGCVAAAAGIAFAGAWQPTFAHANAQGLTELVLKADDRKIVASVPTAICVAVGADGDFVTPTEALYLQNGSVFKIHVSSLKAGAQDGFAFISYKDNSDANTGNANAAEAGAGDESTHNAGTCTIGLIFNELIGEGGSEQGVACDLADYLGAGAKTPAGSWEISRATGDEQTRKMFGYAGYVENSGSVDLSIEQKFGQVEWTFSAGSNKN